MVGTVVLDRDQMSAQDEHHRPGRLTHSTRLPTHGEHLQRRRAGNRRSISLTGKRPTAGGRQHASDFRSHERRGLIIRAEPGRMSAAWFGGLVEAESRSALIGRRWSRSRAGRSASRSSRRVRRMRSRAAHRSGRSRGRALGIVGSPRVETIALQECDRRAAGAVGRNGPGEFGRSPESEGDADELRRTAGFSAGAMHARAYTVLASRLPGSKQGTSACGKQRPTVTLAHLCNAWKHWL